ncbi:MAG: DUF2750 domain-containing protein [Odoribacteraceae bacterium]|jgi:hypothetical protein|nr:DUF2750 domain-containing protein [Odoribacteraceae bacterium]
MKEEETNFRAPYERFIRGACETGLVWTLRDEEGYVTTDSGEYENEEGEALVLFCFWSDEEKARACAIEGWEAYHPEAIPLGAFLEEWCVWMSDDEMLAGVEFDSSLVGNEQEPLQLVLDIAAELKRQGKEISLAKFDHLDRFVALIDDLTRQAGDVERQETPAV